jgi:hypothetical protein
MVTPARPIAVAAPRCSMHISCSSGASHAVDAVGMLRAHTARRLSRISIARLRQSISGSTRVVPAERYRHGNLIATATLLLAQLQYGLNLRVMRAAVPLLRQKCQRVRAMMPVTMPTRGSGSLKAAPVCSRRWA